METNTGVSTKCPAPGKCATTFPSPGAMAATFNRSLWRAKATVQSTEQRALFNSGARRGQHATPIGLNGWGPNINVVRDMRYGRNSELPSEDPLLNGAYAVEVTKGMQESGDAKWPLKIHSTLKHYTAYSVETNRFGFIGNTTLYDMFDSFLPQYKAGLMEGGSGGAMCSYMSLRVGANESTPSCASDFLLNHMVRDVWGRPDALIVSDCEAVAAQYQHNHIARSCPAAAANTINAGCDLNTGYPFYQGGCLNASLQSGAVAPHTVDTALGRSLLWRFKLGLFDDPAGQALARVGMGEVNTTASQALVQEAAAQGMVLLRNHEATLPLAGANLKVAVVGSHAKATRSLLSDYYGDEVCFGKATGSPHTADQCIEQIGHSVAAANKRQGGGLTRIEPGIGVTDGSNATAVAAAMAAVAWSDTVVLALGIDHSIEHESIDRRDSLLPPVQVAFALEVLKAGKPVVLVLVNGGILSIDALINTHASSASSSPAPFPPPVARPSGNNCSGGSYEAGIDYRNQDSQTYAHAGSVEECCGLCAARAPPCKYFTYTGNSTMHDRARSNCYMKATNANRVQAKGAVSGSCSTTPAPPVHVPTPRAIIEAFYPNQAGAAAVGPALFGETNRWGRLPVTVYPAKYNDELVIEDLRMRADPSTTYPGRTYKYYTGQPLFEFGAGLSLTTFNTTCTHTLDAGGAGRGEGRGSAAPSVLRLSCTVRNTGGVVGDEVLLLFHTPPSAPRGEQQRPIRRLIDFTRVGDVEPGASATVSFEVNVPEELLLVAEDGTPRLVHGAHTVGLQGGPSFTVPL